MQLLQQLLIKYQSILEFNVDEKLILEEAYNQLHNFRAEGDKNSASNLNLQNIK